MEFPPPTSLLRRLSIQQSQSALWLESMDW